MILTFQFKFNLLTIIYFTIHNPWNKQLENIDLVKSEFVIDDNISCSQSRARSWRNEVTSGRGIYCSAYSVTSVKRLKNTNCWSQLFIYLMALFPEKDQGCSLAHKNFEDRSHPHPISITKHAHFVFQVQGWGGGTMFNQQIAVCFSYFHKYLTFHDPKLDYKCIYLGSWQSQLFDSYQHLRRAIQ